MTFNSLNEIENNNEKGKERMKILYEDSDIIVVKKDAGMAVETKKFMENDMVSELKNYISDSLESDREPYVGVIHRLDQPVEGVMVFAKNKKAAAALSRQIQQGKIKKYYLTVTQGEMKKLSGTCEDFLVSDEKTNLTRIAEKTAKNAKKAVLKYEVLKTKKINDETKNLVRIELITGRHHQIRVQMSHLGNPLWNDVRYGFKGEKQGTEIALCAYSLSFERLKDGKRMKYTIKPTGKEFGEFEVSPLSCIVAEQ